jgi:hypothetical protein
VSISSGRFGLVGVLIAALLVFGLPAGRAPVWNPDEARHMLLARDILEHGRWLIPTCAVSPISTNRTSSSGPSPSPRCPAVR